MVAVLAMTVGLLTYASLEQRSQAAPSVPDGFVLEDLPSGQESQLTDVAQTPDGGYFTTSKTGHVAWVSADGAVVPLADLGVDASGDLGLTGIAVAADYATSREIYTVRTTATGKMRLSAWIASGTGQPTGLGTERVVLEADRRSDVHSVGALITDTDGTLWMAIGDSADFMYSDPLAFDVYDPNKPYGKLLHVNPDGTGVATNPAYDAANPSSWASRAYASGFRSPFRLSIDPGSGAPIVGDVGWMSWEEVNLVRPGNNYGWPCWEGDQVTSGYSDMPECQGTENTEPLYTYRHAGGGASVTGGLVYTGTSYPEQYRGVYFFGDYSAASVQTLRLRDDAGQAIEDPQAEPFGAQVGGPVKFIAMENGDIAYADIYTSTIKRIVYKPGNRAPVAKASSVVTPETRSVAFDASATYDLDGDELTYTWDFGDGETGTGLQVTHTYPEEPREFTAELTVSDGKDGTGTYLLKVIPSNHSPVIDWVAPPDSAVFKVGDPVTINATVTDAEDDAAGEPLTLTWETVMVHCVGTSCHDHPSVSFTGNLYDKQFVDHGDDTYLQITAHVTDSDGVKTQRVYQARPKLVTMTVRSTTPANVTINGRALHTTTVTSGAQLSVTAPEFAADGVATFKSWQNGGTNRTLLMTMPDADTVLDVVYETPIDKRYAADPAFRARLGNPVSEEIGGHDVRFRDFQYGRAYWSEEHGVHSMGGAILETYLAEGGARKFREPTTDEMTAPDGVGRYTYFGWGGAAYWTPNTGAHMVYGSNMQQWAALGLETGPLGYPTSSERDTDAPGGRYNNFQGGVIIWSQATGSNAVYGDIYRSFAANGYEWGPLGFPTTDELNTARPGGRHNNFQNGTIIWSLNTGAHAVYGSIFVKYGQQGWDSGVLGFPTTDELNTARPGGRYNNFQGGTIIWSAGTGAQQVQGLILQKYGEYGWDNGRLGFPTTSEMPLPGGAYNHFEYGSIYWSPANGAHAVYGAIRDRWAARGWENSYLGYPISEEYAVPGGRRQDFQHGFVVFTTATGQVGDWWY
ncbi:MAG TPA: PQQ-dependent sugar dehydrogenase [Yinghuangia sp.]|nr:PQQ-dependent sugar dehydrogenase [Yinghuangia sp.]